MKSHSPLRYPGGKSKIADRIGRIILHNNLRGTRFAEPYTGGASVSLYLLANGMISQAFFNDLDYSVYCFWKMATMRNRQLCEAVERIPVTIDEWHRQAEIRRNPERHSEFEVGLSAFFLNRSNFSGVLSSKPVGGLDQSGKNKIDARFRKKGELERLREISRFAPRIRVFNMKAVDFVNSCADMVLFLDPPYIDQHNLYAVLESDIEDMADSLRFRGCPWMLTHSKVDEFGKLYSWANVDTFDMPYSFRNSRKSGSEYLIWNNFEMPDGIVSGNPDGETALSSVQPNLPGM